METAFYLFVLGAISSLTEAAGILPDGPLIATVGGSVMINTTLTEADGPFDSVIWNFNVTSFIISYNPSLTDIDPTYKDRITHYPSTASLELRNLTLDDGGEYSVTVVPNGVGRINLDIYGKQLI
ncbi:hypothetical protein FQA47_012558 [Oryzias melastigma]|uniref:Immunoglobulin subtype domain-containing protein n=1 Tax=Oryzias melastigma TaxID=30732 RepID=A0A834F354_ORYME|nr:hypothetical protein FQA47_012558 [Oryzias melastigma]